MSLKEYTPAETAQLLNEGKILLVDVREIPENQAERIAGAMLLPLSGFDPALIKAPPGVEVVFHCGIGKRSRMAIERCRLLNVPYESHMQGGLAAWKSAGLPTER